MKKLPHLAQALIIFTTGLGCLAVIRCFYVALATSTSQYWEILFFIALSTLAGSKRIHLGRKKSADDSGSMSLGFIITFLSMIHFGPAVGVLICTLGCLSSCLWPNRQPTYQIFFNVSLNAFQIWVAGTVFSALNAGRQLSPSVHTFEAITSSVLVYFAINTGFVASVIGFCTQKRIDTVWKETFLWTAPSYFAGASVATLAKMIFRNDLTAVALLIAPVAFLIFHSYSIYTSRAEEKQQHIEDLSQSKAKLADLYLATIKSLALAIDAKDQYTHQHILRVQRYAVATATEMGITGDEWEGVNTGALLHDIGKLGVPEYVLMKPGRLTEEEFAKIKKHPEIGAAILDPVEFPWPVLPGVKYHHEKWNGTGYPDGLAGENIPLTARILAVADVYDALTSSRSYRHAWTHEKAIATIQQDSGTHFDPVIVEAFMKIIDRVVNEMAIDGQGPLAPKDGKIEAPKSKMEGAARDIQRASSELWALYEVSQTLSCSLGLQETLGILAHKLESIVPGTGCIFLLKNEKEEGLTARVAVGLNREFFEGCSNLDKNGCSARVALSRETYLGEYDADDLLINSSLSSQWTPLNTALIVPIIHQGEVLGSINLYHPNAKAFSDYDRHLLETIAEKVAMALYNGLLYDRTRSHALTDPLTGLHNVRFLTQYVEELCRKNLKTDENEGEYEGEYENEESLSGSLANQDTLIDAFQISSDRFALLCLDLDSFKPINDNFGHQRGDQVLRDLSRIFLKNVCKKDVVARYGGDEFLIVLNGVGAEEAEAMIQLLQNEVESYDPELVHAKLGSLRLGVSIGFACFPEEGRDCASLLAAADSKMYADKTERKLGFMAERSKAIISEDFPVVLRIAA